MTRNLCIFLTSSSICVPLKPFNDPIMTTTCRRLFYIAYAVGCAFYCLGLAQEIQVTLFPANDSVWLQTGLASGGLLLVLIIALGGAEMFTKINVLLFGVQFGAIIFGIVSMYFNSSAVGTLPNGGNFTGFKLHNLKQNMFPKLGRVECADTSHPEKRQTYQDVLAVIFPCVTGIMEGANLSGDLKNPSKSIPTGTVMAVAGRCSSLTRISFLLPLSHPLSSLLFTSLLRYSILFLFLDETRTGAYVWYIVLILSMAAVFTREALIMNCIPMQDVAFSPLVIIIGITVSASSSALGALFGGARVLQALSRDKLYGGYLKPFAMGTAHGDEPRNAVFLTWAIAQSCCLIGSLNVVAGFITSFFCLS